jgi:hypothetical protein
MQTFIVCTQASSSKFFIARRAALRGNIHDSEGTEDQLCKSYKLTSFMAVARRKQAALSFVVH